MSQECPHPWRLEHRQILEFEVSDGEAVAARVNDDQFIQLDVAVAPEGDANWDVSNMTSGKVMYCSICLNYLCKYK